MPYLLSLLILSVIFILSFMIRPTRRQGINVLITRGIVLIALFVLAFFVHKRQQVNFSFIMVILAVGPPVILLYIISRLR